MSTDNAPSANMPANVPEILRGWVTGVAGLTRPESIHWCDGSQTEREQLEAGLVASGIFVKLNEEKRPGSYLVRTAPSDVARAAGRTFICCERADDAGPTNHWADPAEMKKMLARLFDGCMRGRTMYVVPFCLGAPGSESARIGVEVTDSPYVVVTLGALARVGQPVMERIAKGEYWMPSVHSVGYPLVDDKGVRREETAWPCNDQKYVAHFPETREIWSYGSGYAGNAVLSNKGYGLRIASVIARDEGWMAAHMLILRATSPQGRVFHVAAAFPSGCGKTDLAMIRSTIPGWAFETVGDDVAWLHRGEDGRLYAANPEAGFYGIAPGVSPATNPVASEALAGEAIFTDVALTDDGDVWWEGLTDEPPAHLRDWRGEEWTPESGAPAAHPNGRFTIRAGRVASMAPGWDDPAGVPVDAILFGGRRSANVPLVSEAYSWEHGVFIGATMSSEHVDESEAADETSLPRHDPFAMSSLCGYNMADYWGQWLALGKELGAQAPHVFQVNWFGKNSDGEFLWPGFGENGRVLEWVLRRVAGEVDATDAIAGRVPVAGDLNVEGLNFDDERVAALFAVDPSAWAAQADEIDEYIAQFGPKVPDAIRAQLADLRGRIAFMGSHS